MTLPAYTRSCTCPTGPRQPGEHTASCNDTYREGFFEFTRAFQRSFFARPHHNAPYEDTT